MYGHHPSRSHSRNRGCNRVPLVVCKLTAIAPRRAMDTGTCSSAARAAGIATEKPPTGMPSPAMLARWDKPARPSIGFSTTTSSRVPGEWASRGVFRPALTCIIRLRALARQRQSWWNTVLTEGAFLLRASFFRCLALPPPEPDHDAADYDRGDGHAEHHPEIEFQHARLHCLVLGSRI
jgi:hypothetical protein